MTVITFVEFNGTEHQVDAETGATVMETALKHNVPGIDADCGGSAVCGTCHCFVTQTEAFPAVDAQEEAMLGMRPDREGDSRLSCQLVIAEHTPDITVRLPEFQM